MASIFTKIINGDIPSYKVAEDEHHYAFLDVNPVKRGHVLVVPKKEEDYIFDLADDVLAALHVFSSKVARAMKKSVPCKRIGVAVVGLEVPHVHIHLIPLETIADINFANPRVKLSPEEFQEIAGQISAAL